MKLFFYTTLLLAVSFFTVSCKTKRDQVMKNHYRGANKYSAMEYQLLRDNKDLLFNTPSKKTGSQQYEDHAGLQSYQSQENTGGYKVLYDDSEYVNGDVYREAAAHRQMLIDKANKDCNCNSTETNKGTSNTNSMTTPSTNTKTSPTVNISSTKPVVSPNVKATTSTNNAKTTTPVNTNPATNTSNTKPTVTSNTKATAAVNTSSTKPVVTSNTQSNTATINTSSTKPTVTSNAKSTIAANTSNSTKPIAKPNIQTSPTVKTSNVQPVASSNAKETIAANLNDTKPTAKPTATNTTTKTTNVNSTAPASTTVAATVNVAPETSHTPDFFADLTDTDKKAIRKVGISYVDEKDKLLLKDYSVIIASFSQPEKMDPLKRALTSSVDKLFFVKNDANIYYAIFGSYNTENEAQQKIRRIWMEYTNLYTTEQLNNKYGITFTDLYILKK